MTIVPFKTYLRTYRKRAGLTHEEVAFLCGAMCGTSVSRHERGVRLPLLRTALTYEIVLGVSVRELYEGLFREAIGTVQTRAAGLYRSIEREPENATRDLKLRHLKALISELGTFQSLTG
jgi:transcriptional regulator with XRE-family HTH domain